MEPVEHSDAVATAFLLLLAAGDLSRAWPLADVDWQRQQLEEWVAYLRDPAVQVPDVDDAPDQWWWDTFLLVTGRLLAHEFRFIDPTRWAPGDSWRPVPVDRELVVFIDTGGTPVILEEGEEPSGPRVEVLMHLVDGRWLVEAVKHINGSPAA